MRCDCYIPSGCAVSGIMSKAGERMDGNDIIRSIALMHDRSNGLGGGFAAYGIYPRHANEYAFHMMFDNMEAKDQCEEYLKDTFDIVLDEEIPTRPGAVFEQDTSGRSAECGTQPITSPPILWRYFMDVPEHRTTFVSEREYVVEKVMDINSKFTGTFVASSGKNMGAFKGVGYPEDIGMFYKLDEYKGYIWTAHGRFPTNTPGWWGGAHPFCLLDWSIVHNGEISSYGINKRYLEPFGYKLELRTDTEVVAYLFDLLVRRHKMPMDLAVRALASPFWKDIDRMPKREQKIATAIRQVYGGALLNGPFSIILGYSRGMVGFNDRIKLRPMTCATKGDDMLYMSSEESAIREIADPDTVWSPKAGTAVIGELNWEVE
ncbi:MAG: glutamine amidotransferase family protein [ANME-2 cluster archaeon]|nr:glutamine amidotransferase family protein [ANME-2 cluster archaeon]MBC2707988.1 glutamine amidotransferase family protein [ANME-2 cluster archaeon]MBC2764044.1 glutamine amidotransferase family protein [ANME-2 cluster archaeon]